jgi:hypothetical protein
MGTSNAFAYPIGYKISHFRQARRLLLATSQAAGPLWEFRWGNTAGHLCLIKRILVSGAQIANATAEELRFSLRVARGFTAVDNTNVVSILRSGENQKLVGDTRDSVLTAFVESNAATAASGGTFTSDTDPTSNGSYISLAAVTTTFPSSDLEIIDFNPFFEGLTQCLVFEQDEGFTINLDVTKGATQGFILNMEVAWVECFKPTTTVGGFSPQQ